MSKSKEQGIDEIQEDARYYGRVMIVYAQSQAITFAEWMDNKAVRNGFHEWTVGVGNATKRYTSEELYDLFLQSQNKVNERRRNR